MRTIMITGTSSGYGQAIARHFLEQGWQVIATMRTPNPDALPRSPHLRILPLDVTSQESIDAAVAAAGPLDALVNNAGIGLAGPFEATPMAYIRQVFETNTLGVMAMCQAVIPQLRERRAGVIVNVTSSVTLEAKPLVAVYTASKQAIEGFTGSLAHELGHFNVQVRLVEPGYCPTTRFAQNTGIDLQSLLIPPYLEFAMPVLERFTQPTLTTQPEDVAAAVWAAVHEPSDRLHFPAGADAEALRAAPSGPAGHLPH